MKILILVFLTSINIAAQQIKTTETTFADSFAVLGENVEDLFIDPEIEGRLIATTGVNKPKIKISNDYGKSWTSAEINTSNFSKPFVKPYEISFNTSDYNIGYVAAGIDLYKTTDRGESWDSTGFSDLFPEYDLRNWTEIRKVNIHSYNPKIMFTSSGGPFSHLPLTFRSIDYGVTWSIADTGKISGFAFNYSDTNIIYGIKDYSTICKSINSGEIWESINNNLEFSHNGVRSLTILNNNPNILYCGQWYEYDNPNIWRLSITYNGGESWSRIDSALLAIDPNGSVYDILLDQNKEGRFYVAYTGGLYLTEDNGKHFQKIYSGEVAKIWSDNKTPAIIYFNSDKGLLSFTDTFVVGINNRPEIIENEFNLYQNYPNPFNPTTTIKYSLPQITQPLIPSREGKERSDRGVLVTLKVYDVLGREITTLVNKKQSPGTYEVIFNAVELPSGIYFYKLTARNFSQVRKMILMK